MLSIEQRTEVAILATLRDELGNLLYSYSQVGTRVGITKQAVSYIVRKYRNGESLEDAPRSGRPPILNNKKKNAVINKVNKNPWLNAKQIARNEGVSHDTINRLLNEAGLMAFKPAFKPSLSVEQKKARMRWARQFSDWDITMWRRVLFTDESLIDLSSGPRNVYVRRPTGERYNPRFVSQTRKRYGGGVKLMVWAGIMYKKQTGLYEMNGGITGQVYSEFLRDKIFPDMQQLIPNGYIFMDDNAPCHRARVVMEMKEEREIDCLEWWPANSPDLNPIENMWGILKEKIRHRNPKNKQELWQFAIEEWENISFQTINNIINSMPNRIQLVIRARGNSIRY